MFNGVTKPIDYGNVSTSATLDFEGNRSFNPIGYLPTGPQPTHSGADIRNPFPFACQIMVSGGTVTNIGVEGKNTGLTSGTFMIPVGTVIDVD